MIPASRVKVSVEHLPKLQRAVAERLFPDQATLTPKDIQQSLRQLSGDKDIETEAALRDLLKVVSNPGAIVDNVAAVSEGQVGLGAAQARSADPVLNARQREIADKVAAFQSELDKQVKGQSLFKSVLTGALEARLSERVPDPVPISIVLAGPSGIGKSSGAAALARVLNDDPNARVILFDCTEIGTSAELSKWKGAAPNYVGYGEPTPINDESLAAAGKRPVILVDEISRAGKGLPPDQRKALQEEIYSYFANFVDTGTMPDKKGMPIKQLQGATIIFATNAGYDDPALPNMSVEQRRTHYQNAAMREIPKQMVGRIGKSRVVGMDELGSSDIGEIFADKFRSEANQLVDSVKAAQGFDISFAPPTDDLKSFIGEATASRDFGTRNLVHTMKQLVKPLINTTDYAEDGRYQLQLKPMTDLERSQLITAFQSADGVPPGITASTSPFQIKNLNTRPMIGDYNSPVPSSSEANMTIFGGGKVGGRSFMISNSGDFESLNEMHFIKPGGVVRGVQVPDTFLKVDVPKEFAEGFPGAYVTEIDDNRFMLIGLTLPEDGDEAVQHAYVFDVTKPKGEQFVKVDAPPLALWGAGMFSANGLVYVRGGREITSAVENDVKTWYPNNDVEMNNGVVMQPMTLEFDPSRPAKKQWRFLEPEEAGSMAPRAGYAVVKGPNGEVILAGGETWVEGPPGTSPYSASSTAVDIFNPETRRFEEGPPLKVATAYATGVTTGDTVEILGGVGLILNRSTGMLGVSPKATIQSLNLSAKVPKVKVRVDEQVPPGASQIRAIPAVGGVVLGPFYDAGGDFTPRFHRYAQPADSE